MKKFLTVLKGIFLLLWISVTTLIYGTLCLVVRIVSESWSRAITEFWIWNIIVLGGIKVEVKGIDRLDKTKNYIFVANHQSYIDICAVLHGLPFKISFIAKKSLFYIPFFGWCIAAIGHIPIDRSNPAKARISIEKAIRQIHKKKRSIFAFPEGTRNTTDGVAEFKLGAFSLAIKAGIDIVPVVIHGARKIMPRGDYFIKPGKITLEILEPVNITGYKKTSKNILAGEIREKLESHLKDFSAYN
ncbi:MAG: 1-acyl-sn-glycerol-3-phosphate acyltransferase [Spirochaetales bacterium]|nr:1-acyl-sn-glycerol-3-phosphate acyltransferase [Spirochaetales bacterium]